MTESGYVHTREHVVLFYADEAELRRRAGTYLIDALRAGSVAAVIATGAHREMFEAEITAAGLDPNELRLTGSWVTLDARETLDRLLVDGQPDRAAFESIVGKVISEGCERGRSVCAYGELVALLWESRHVNAAMELERLWNKLGERRPFSLFCSYSASSFSEPSDARDIEAICAQHSSVIDPKLHQMSAQPPARERSYAFSAAPESVTHARRFVTATTAQWKLPRIVDDAALIVSELAGNAVRHARSDFAVVISERDSIVRIAVTDLSPAVPTPRALKPDASSGRGLMLVAALAAKWGVEPWLGGKVVWADLQP